MAKREGYLLAAAFLAFIFWPRRAAAYPSPSLTVTYPPFDPWEPATPEYPALPVLDDWDYSGFYNPEIVPPVWEDLNIPDVNIDASEKLRAFLYTIRAAETSVEAARQGESYFIFYGGSRFRNLSDHPVITGEMKPVRLPDAWCKPAGFSAPCYTTAAGAYQFTRPTWERVRKAGAWGPYLPDFTKSSQDEAARRLIVEAGAWSSLVRDDLETAIRKISHLWASLPGSEAGQNMATMDAIISFYDDGFYWG